MDHRGEHPVPEAEVLVARESAEGVEAPEVPGLDAGVVRAAELAERRVAAQPGEARVDAVPLPRPAGGKVLLIRPLPGVGDTSLGLRPSKIRHDGLELALGGLREDQRSVDAQVGGIGEHPIRDRGGDGLAVRAGVRVDSVPDPEPVAPQLRGPDLLPPCVQLDQVRFSLVRNAGRRLDREEVVEGANGVQVGVQEGDPLVATAEGAVPPEPEGVQAREDVGDVLPSLRPAVGEPDLRHLEYAVIERLERLARLRADLRSDEADEVGFAPLPAQSVRRGERARQVAVVHHHEGHEGKACPSGAVAHRGRRGKAPRVYGHGGTSRSAAGWHSVHPAMCRCCLGFPPAAPPGRARRSHMRPTTYPSSGNPALQTGQERGKASLGG
jgi:hypothetical protein